MPRTSARSSPARWCACRRRASRASIPFPAAPRTSCVFEYVYFARPDSRVYDRNVYEVRKELGRQLAREQPVEADIVIPVPDSGVPAALGYAEQAGLAVRDGADPQPLRRPHVHRAARRHPPLRREGEAERASRRARGKRVVVVDDSIVRGTTSRKIVQMLRDAGAREVHMRISSPPTIGSCYYGVDTPTPRGADRLVELGRGDPRLHHRRQPRLPERAGPVRFLQAGDGDGFCAACFTGRYPVPVSDQGRTHQLVLFEAKER